MFGIVTIHALTYGAVAHIMIRVMTLFVIWRKMKLPLFDKIVVCRLVCAAYNLLYMGL